MTRPRARFLHRHGDEYVFAVDTGLGFWSSWALVRVPVAEFWRAP